MCRVRNLNKDINIIITYRNEGDNSYLPLIDMVVENVKKWEYKPIIIGDMKIKNKIYG